MKYKTLKLITLFLFGIGLTGLKAQEAIPTSGGNASGSGGSVSYSVGEVVYTTNIGSNGSEAQGVQQPYEISVVNGLEEAEGIHLNFTTYPNPTKDFLTLKVENYDKENLSYNLYDINGKLLTNKILSGNETIISMENFVPATYFLKVLQSKQGSIQVIKTFKIVKN